jgi:hypothetical protein
MGCVKVTELGLGVELGILKAMGSIPGYSTDQVHAGLTTVVYREIASTLFPLL